MTIRIFEMANSWNSNREPLADIRGAKQYGTPGVGWLTFTLSNLTRIVAVQADENVRIAIGNDPVNEANIANTAFKLVADETREFPCEPGQKLIYKAG